MDILQKQRLEYECQLFGFTSTFFLQSFEENLLHDTVMSILNKLVKNIENKLINECKDVDVFQQKTKQMQEKLFALYKTGIEDAMVKLRNLVESYVSIPDNVVLPEDESVDTSHKENLAEVEEVVEKQKKEKQNCEFMKVYLRSELDKTNKVIDALEKTKKKRKWCRDMEREICEMTSFKKIRLMAEETVKLAQTAKKSSLYLNDMPL